jgi:hypothetical protein
MHELLDIGIVVDINVDRLPLFEAKDRPGELPL